MAKKDRLRVFCGYRGDVVTAGKVLGRSIPASLRKLMQVL